MRKSAFVTALAVLSMSTGAIAQPSAQQSSADLNTQIEQVAAEISRILAPLLISADGVAQQSVDQPMTDISSLIRRAAADIGKEIVVDPRLPASIRAYTTEADPDFESVRALLRIYGFIAIETADQVLIIREQEARTSPSRLLQEDDRNVSDHEIVTRVLQVPMRPDRRADARSGAQPDVNPLSGPIAAQLVPVLRPMLSTQAQLAAAPNSNTLVVVDYYDNVRRITAIVEEIVADSED